MKSCAVCPSTCYNFVPLEQEEDRLIIAVSDPSKLMMLDEISGLLGQRIVTRVATLSQITELLKKTEQSQRVLDEASEGLTFDVLSADDNSDENISIEKLTSEEDIRHSNGAPPTFTLRPSTIPC
jgi:type IV pilus assembly protein PilB